MQEHRAQISARIVAHREEMTAHYQGLRNDMGYFTDSICYMESHLGALFMRHEVRAPDPIAHARPLPPTGPPFPVKTLTVPLAPQPAVAEIDSDEETSEEADEDGSEDGSEEDGSDEDGSDLDEE